MSARNSLRERRCSSVLPHLAPPSATTRRDVFPLSSLYDRSLTPFYDYLSESDTGFGTPDIRSEESDSSAGSALHQATTAASRVLAAEWERVERTLYDEPGEHVRRPQLLDECEQWKELFPHLRIVGKKIQLPERRLLCYDTPDEEVIAAHYSDSNELSESEERLSESSFSDTTPSNSPRVTHQPIIPTAEPKLNREKSAYATHYNDIDLNNSFYSMLQIKPLYPRSPPLGSSVGKRHYSSIIKSEISSSKWTRNHSPDSPRTKCDRNSAKSFVSMNMRNGNSIAFSANERKKLHNGSRVYTPKQKDQARLQPLFGYQTVLGDGSRQPVNTNSRFANGKVSLPPLHIEAEKTKVKCVNSARKNTSKRLRRSAAQRAITLISETKNF